MSMVQTKYSIQIVEDGTMQVLRAKRVIIDDVRTAWGPWEAADQDDLTFVAERLNDAMRRETSTVDTEQLDSAAIGGQHSLFSK